jgi:hypothetical protein
MAAPSLRCEHNDAHALALDLLPGVDLGGLAALGLAINTDRAGGDQLFAPPAAVGNAGELEQVAKADVFVTQSEFTGFQDFAAVMINGT